MQLHAATELWSAFTRVCVYKNRRVNAQKNGLLAWMSVLHKKVNLHFKKEEKIYYTYVFPRHHTAYGWNMWIKSCVMSFSYVLKWAEIRKLISKYFDSWITQTSPLPSSLVYLLF